MLKYFKGDWKKKLYRIRSFLIAKLGKGVLNLLIRTCRIQIEGLDPFCQLVSKEKCILMLWHNRLALALFVLSRYTPQIRYAALVSGSRDGDILNYIINSYQNGGTIRVPHLGRYQALRDFIHHVEERKQIVVITPDGPRGPRYEVKPGIAVAALETQATIASLNWEAKDYWELKTWDRFRLPKPFTTIRVTFDTSLRFDKIPQPSIEETKAMLRENLPQD
jgi:lysophospholipid acyltransferase (LPLAT)-like uncharacterized protein